MNFDVISFLIGALVALGLGWWLGSSSTARQLRELQDAKGKLEDERQKTAQKLESALASQQGNSQQVATLEGELASLKTRLPKLEGFERANADLRLQLQGFDTVRQKLQAAEQEVASLRPKAAEFEALAQKLETTQQEFSQYKTRTAGFEVLSAKADLASELEGKVGLLEQQKQKHLAELAQMSVKVSDAEVAQQKLRQSLDESLNEISRLRGGIKAFETLEKKVAEVDALGISPEAQAKIAGLETELSAYQNRVLQLEERLKQIPELEAQVRRLSMLETAKPAMLEPEAIAPEPVVEVVTPDPVVEVVTPNPTMLEPVETTSESVTEVAALEPVQPTDNPPT